MNDIASDFCRNINNSITSSSLYEIPPPLDLTRGSRRLSRFLEVHGDSAGSAESTDVNSDTGDYKGSIQKSEVDSEEENTMNLPPLEAIRDRPVRVKSEDGTSPLRRVIPSPEPLYGSVHPFGRFMNYVHHMNSMSLMRQQYTIHQNLAQPHLLPSSTPVLPADISTVRQLHDTHPRVSRSMSNPTTRSAVEDRRSPPKSPVKDESYFERRRKNNEAAKRSRDLRRMKEEEMARRAKHLENENSVLRAENNVLKFEIRRLHSLLSSTLSNPER